MVESILTTAADAAPARALDIIYRIRLLGCTESPALSRFFRKKKWGIKGVQYEWRPPQGLAKTRPRIDKKACMIVWAGLRPTTFGFEVRNASWKIPLFAEQVHLSALLNVST